MSKLRCLLSLFIGSMSMLLSANAMAVTIFVESEDYNLGGEGLGYHDDNTRQGNYDNGRGETVDLENASENGQNVGYVTTGEWLAYDIHVPVAGSYRLDVRNARNTSGNGKFHLEINGADITGVLTTPPTGGWQTYQTSSFSNIAFDAGLQTVRMVFDASSVNINWFELTLEAAVNSTNTPPDFAPITTQNNSTGESIDLFVSANDIDGDTLTYGAVGLPPQLLIDSGTGQISGTLTEVGTYNVTVTVGDNNGGSDSESFTWIVGLQSTRIAIPGILQAEDYNAGGQNVGYFDTTPGNQGSHVGFTDDIDISGSVGFRTATSFVINGEWATYNVSIATAGTYTIDVRQGREASPLNLRIELDGQIIDRLPLPNTGSFSTYVTTSFPGIELPAGDYTMRLYFEGSGVSLDYLNFTLTQAAAGSNAPPILNETGNQFNVEGESVELGISATDLEGDTLTYSATGLPPQLLIDSGTGQISGTATEVGIYNVTVSVDDNNGGVDSESFTWVISGPGSRIAIPGRLQVEDYNSGGQGVGYFDTTPGNQGDAPDFTDDIDIGGVLTRKVLTLVIRDEWATYAVDVTTAGIYTIDVRQAREANTLRLRIELDGVVIDRLLLPNTGSFSASAMQTSSFPNIALPAGKHTMRLYYEGSGTTLDYLQFTLTQPLEGDNALPVLADIVDQTHAEGEGVSLQVSATDLEGDTLTYSAAGLPPQLAIDSGTGQITGTVTQAGTYNVTVTVNDGRDSDSTSFLWQINPPSPRIVIPGRLQAEDYNPGGQNIGYFDTTLGNQGSHVGFTDDIDVSGSTGFRTALSYVINNEWARYNVNIETAGTYTINVRQGREANPLRLRIELDGQTIDRLLLPNTGSFSTYTTTSFTGIALPAGDFTMRLYFEGSGVSLDYLDFVLTEVAAGSNAVPKFSPIADRTHAQGEEVSLALSASDFDGDTLTYSAAGLPPQLSINSGTGQISGTVTQAGTYNVTVTVNDGKGGSDSVDFIWQVNTTGQRIGIPGRLQAEDYNPGGQNIGYFDTTLGNQSSHVGFTDDIDISGSTGFRVATSFVINNEWARYNVNIAEAGIYTIDVRQGRQANTLRLRIELDDQVIDRLLLPNTGSFSTYTTTSFPGIALPAGDFTMRLYFEGSGVSLDYLDFILTESTSTEPPPNSLIASGSEWKYLDDGSNQGTAWRANGFDDSAWLIGLAQLGYGDGDEATTISFGSDSNNKHITTYFRRSFNIDDTSTIDDLRFNLLRDDGAVVYLNGEEVIRSNMQDGTISYTARALIGADGVDESTFVSYAIPESLLVNGNNVIAVEIHQHRPTSSDLSFDLRATFRETIGTNTNTPPVAEDAIFSIAVDTALSNSFSATDADADALTYRIGNAPSSGVVVIDNANTGAFTYTTNAAFVGTDSFTFIANDGLVDSNSATVTINSIGAPVITIVAPPDGLLTNQQTIAVTGTVINTETLTFNGEAVSLDVDGGFTIADIILNEGENTLTFIATSAVGTTAEATLTINRDSVAPVITVTTPADGIITGVGSLTISGSLSEAATLTLNGDAVTVNPDNSFTVTDAPLTEGANTFSFVATDAAGNQSELSISITRDSAAPVISISSPQNNSVTNQAELTISGTVEGADALTLNGGPVTLAADGSFSQGPVTLAEGNNSFTFIATDSVGNSAEVVLVVTLDRTTPIITISSPFDGSVTQDATVDVLGSLSEAAALTLNGNAVALNEDNSFSLPATPLNEGENIFTFVALDAAGNQTERSITVTRDSLAPVINITSPQNGAITNQSNLTILGNVDSAITLTIDGSPVALGNSGEFNIGPITLVEGANSFVLAATDDVGNSAELTLSITLDSISPVITVNSPVDGAFTQAAAQNISGSLSEAATLTLNGNALALAGDNSFSQADAPLVEGSNVFTFVATDAAGNSSQVVVTVTRDTQAPVITITTPQDGLITNQEQLAILGNASGAASLTLDDVPVSIGSDGAFSTGNIALNEGENGFTLIATDAAGNSSQVSLTITRDSITPVITLTEPVDGLVTNASDQGFAGSVSEAANLTFNDIAIPLAADNSFTIAPIPLNNGANSFTFIATDAAGNSSQVVVTVTRDTVGPTITITSPANNTLISVESIGVTGSVSELGSLTINGAATPIAGDLSFSATIPLTEGTNTLTLVATDAAGNLGQAILTITRDSTAPNAPVANLINRSTAQGGIISLQGNNNSVDANITVRITNTRTVETVTVTATNTGSFSAQINGENDDILSILTVDAAGNESAAVSINPPAPVNLTIMPIGNQTAPLGQSLSFNVIAMDEGDAAITLSASPLPLPEGMMFNATTGELDYSPTISQVGSFDLTFIARTLTEEVNETVTFTVPAPDAAAPTVFSGRVIDANDFANDVVTPVIGATITFLDSTVSTTTDIEGRFSLEGAPAGEPVLSIDTTTASPAPGGALYAQFRERVEIIPNVTNVVERPFSMPRIAMASLTQVIPTQTTTVTNAEMGVTIVVPPNTAMNDDGSQFVGQLSISPVPENLAPAALPDFLNFSMLVTIQPAGVVFNQPIPITFPNTDGLTANSEIDIWSLNPVTGQFEVVGAGRVSSNGQEINTISGGIRRADWHGPQPPEAAGDDPTNNDKPCPDCPLVNGSSMFSLNDGHMTTRFSLPTYRSLETDRTWGFDYRTFRAYPRPVVNFNGDFNIRSALPQFISYEVEVGGVMQGREVFTRPEGFGDPFGNSTPFRVAVAFDGTDFESGMYDYELRVTNHFGRVSNGEFQGSSISRVVEGSVMVANDLDSAFGPGWALEGLYSLAFNLDESVTMISPNGDSRTYRPTETPDVFEAPDSDFATFVRNPDGSYTHREKDGIRMVFGSDGLMISHIDRNSNTTAYGYDSQDRVQTITDPVGLVTQFVYGADGLLDSVTDPASRTSTFSHDVEGNLTQITYPDGTFEIFEYDERRLMIAHEDERGNRFTDRYNSFGRIIDGTLPDGTVRAAAGSNARGLVDVSSAAGTLENPVQTLRLADVNGAYVDGRGNPSSKILDANGRTTMEVDEVGRVTMHERDADSNPMRTVRPIGSVVTRTFDDLGNVLTSTEEFNGAVNSFTYDAFSLVTSHSNPRNNRTLYERDNRGNVERMINQLGHTAVMEYDSRGLVTRMVSPNNLVTTYTYNAQGLMETKTETPPAGSPGNVRITQYSYVPSGLLSQMITPDQITYNYVYDERSYLTSVTDNLGQSVTYFYDEHKNVIRVEAHNGNDVLVNTDGSNSLAMLVKNLFDNRNRLIQTATPHTGSLESVTQRVLDQNSNLIGMIDPNGSDSSNGYDPFNRLSEDTHRLDGVSSYEYDDQDRLRKVTASIGVVTEYEYDIISRRTREISSDRGIISYSYDLANNLIQMVDGRGIVVDMSHDQLERVATKTYPNTIVGKIEDVIYSYDSCDFGLGYLCTRNDESGAYSYDYDAFGNPVSMSFTEISGVTYSMRYVYDDGNRIVQMTYPSGRVVNYGRDGVRRINSIQTSVAGQAITLVNNITYRGDNQMLTCDYGNGLSDSRSYDLQGRLLTQQLTGNVGVIDSRAYTYDANSNIISIDTNLEDNVYSYDALDRVIEDSINSDAPVRFEYDLNDNRLAKRSDDLLNTSQISYVQGSNRIAVQDMLTQGNTASFTNRSLLFNDVNRLYQLVEDGVLKAEYIYNDYGRRTRKTIYQQDGQTVDSVTIYHYDHLGYLIEESSESGALIRDYIWQLGAHPVAQIDNTTGTEQVLYLYNDHVMTNRLATDQNQNVVWRWEGEAFGNTSAQELASLTINLRFPGQYFDEETNLHYNNFRYYDPELGRYITSDHIGLTAGLNTYSYVGQNSLGRYDFLGLCDYLGKENVTPYDFTDTDYEFVDEYTIWGPGPRNPQPDDLVPPGPEPDDLRNRGRGMGKKSPLSLPIDQTNYGLYVQIFDKVTTRFWGETYIDVYFCIDECNYPLGEYVRQSDSDDFDDEIERFRWYRISRQQYY